MHNLLDVFKLALFNEVKSQIFYQLAAEITAGDEARMWFIELSGLEEDHAHELIRTTEGRYSLGGFDARAYLRELRSSTSAILSMEEARLFKSGDVGRLLQHAKILELEARDTYLALANGTEDAQLRSYFRNLAAEEQRHHEEILRIGRTLGIESHQVCISSPTSD